MKKQFFRTALGALALAAGAGYAPAQTAGTGEPMIEFHTNLYDMYQEANAFHFVIGSTEATYIDIDFGSGPVETEVTRAVFNPETQSIEGTVVSGSVGPDGIVRIYGDPKKIDYIDFEGIYMSSIKWPEITELQILNMSHNKLKSLDLSHMTKLEALYLDDNEFSESPVVVGANKPHLTIMTANVIGHFDPNFNLSDYPEMKSFISFSNPTLTKLDPTGCPELLQLSIDVTGVESLDVSKNPKLRILNVSDTRIRNVDISKCPQLTEFYCNHDGVSNSAYKLDALDVSHNPNLIRFFCSGNNLTSLDISMLTKLVSFSCARNQLSSINIDSSPDLYDVNISQNNMDFVTIPAERGTFNEYFYEQRPFPVARKYAVGDVLDFSARVNRPGSTTTAKLYAFDETKPSDPVLIDESAYKWENGKLTLLEAYPDSVYVAFSNTELPNAILTTEYFMIKNVEDFDKPTATAAIRFSPITRSYAMSVGLAGATPENPRAFTVDFGDGKPVVFEAKGNGLPEEANVHGTRPSGGNGTVTIYIPEGEQLTALGIDGQRILSADVTKAHALTELSLTNAQLQAIDLTWNRCLKSLNLEGNSLTSLDLTGINGAYTKTMLADVDASGNKLTEFSTDDSSTFRHVDLSDNSFEEISILKWSGAQTIDLSGNMISEIDLRDLEAIEELNLSGNRLSAITLLDYLPLKKLDISCNNMTFAALPAAGCVADYKYAPQNTIAIPEKAPVISLYSYQFEGTEGAGTEYTWYMADTDTPVAAGNIRENDGRFFFTNADLGRIYCTLSNPAFPDFTGENIMRTSVVQTAPMPSYVFASFTPEADTEATLALTGAADNTTVYIDWTGEGDMEQLILKTQYTPFTGHLLANKQAKCYSYDENDGVKVFSLDGGKLTQLDASAMKSLTAFMAYGSGLDESGMKLPVNSELTELSLTDCAMGSTDFLKPFPKLRFLTLSGMHVENPDFSSLPALEGLNYISSGLTSIKLNNPALWDLHLDSNKFKSIDLSGVPNVEQLVLASNELETVDVSGLKNLKVLNLDNNKLTFSTLPLPNDSWYLYSYLGQAPMGIEVIDAKVDLSSQAEINGQPTTYRWFIDSPYLDENDELAGEELIEGTEYTIENGVTTFLTNLEHIMCVMMSPVFPSLYQLTDFVNVEVSGIENVGAGDKNAPVEYFNLQGVRVDSPKAGIYIRRQGNTASKVYIR